MKPLKSAECITLELGITDSICTVIARWRDVSYFLQTLKSEWADALSARERIICLRVKQLNSKHSFSFCATPLEKKYGTTRANRFEMTWSYNSKLHGLKRACSDTVLSKRHRIFRCHIGEQHVHIKDLVIKVYGFKRNLRARLERSAFLDVFFFLHVDTSCTTTLIVEI